MGLPDFLFFCAIQTTEQNTNLYKEHQGVQKPLSNILYYVIILL